MGVLNFAPHGLHQVGGWASLGDDEWQRRYSLRVIFFVQSGQKTLRGGVLGQCGTARIDFIVEHVRGTITAIRHGFSVGSPEIPAIQVVFRNREATFVHQSMMARAQQQQIVETDLTAGRPVLDMVCIDKALIRATRKYTAPVPRPQGTFDGRGHTTGLAADI